MLYYEELQHLGHHDKPNPCLILQNYHYINILQRIYSIQGDKILYVLDVKDDLNQQQEPFVRDKKKE